MEQKSIYEKPKVSAFGRIQYMTLSVSNDMLTDKKYNMKYSI